MIQRLRLLLVTLFALYCGSAFALGLGEIELKSALNQRFEAEIILSNVGDLEQGEIIPNLATQQDFDRVGVNRDYHLTDLRFNARVREDGAHIVHITSSKVIIEPFLNFIVEVIWPTGRILREYIVLLDPPVFSSEGIEKIEPGMSSGNTSSARSGSRSNNRREIPPAPSVSNGRTEGVVTQDEEYGLTGPGDTLWSIASKVRPNDRISVQQTMLALQRANPEAFINNNINLLKAGHVLRIPDESEIHAETSAEAVAEVRVQNQEFEDYRSGDVTQLDARRTASRSSAGSDDSDNDNGELKLLAADQSGARSGRDDARADELENSLAVAREDLDRSRRANSELNVRLADIADQVETLNELVKLKDDQLAALRAELQRQAAETISQPAVPVVVQQQASGSLLSNPLVLGGVGVLLIGLVAGALMMFRKRRQDFQLDDNEFTEIMIEEDEPKLSLSDDADEGSEEDSEYNDEDVTPQTSDVIGEAEIYIAYGRFPQAISFLQNAIENEPQRTDIQLRLLEVYVQTEDATAFNLQYEQLKLLRDDEATREGAELQAEIPGAAETSAAAMDATIVSSEPIAAIEDLGIDDDDLSFDLDDLDLTADTGEELRLDETVELGDADLDLDLDAGLEEVTAESEEEDLDLALGLDDEIDLDFGDDVGDGEDDGLDLDLDDVLELDLDDASDDDALDLDLDLDDDDSLELGDDDSLELVDDDSPELGDDDSLELGDDDSPELGDDDSLELGDDDSLELGDDDAIELDLDDDEEFDLGDFDDDDELNLDEDASSKLDLARAYIEMGDNDGAKPLLQEVLEEGDDVQVNEANELLGNISGKA
ncbi:MAG: FimV family protein [Gammaproteobacteria bacterium]|nr:FimV family protein [Gammaproteobacteria bacterium]